MRLEANKDNSLPRFFYNNEKEAIAVVTEWNEKMGGIIHVDGLFTYELNPLQYYDLFLDVRNTHSLYEHLYNASESLRGAINGGQNWDDSYYDELIMERAKIDESLSLVQRVILGWCGKTKNIKGVLLNDCN